VPTSVSRMKGRRKASVKIGKRLTVNIFVYDAASFNDAAGDVAVLVSY